MRIATLFSLALLAGCASAQSVYQSAADETVESAKPLAEVSSCIALSFGFPPISTAAGESTFIHKGAYGGTLATLSLSPTATGGTRIVLRRVHGMVQLPSWRKCA